MTPAEKAIIDKLKFLDGTNRNNPNVLRLVRMYGDRITHFGGGNEEGRKPDNSFLWKPDSDNNGKLVVITPSNLKAGYVTVGGESQSSLSIGNGWRPHFRFSKPGANGYGSSPRVTVDGAGSATIASPSKKQSFKISYKPHVDGSAPATPGPQPVPPPAAVQAIILPPEYAAKVGLVAVLSGRKMHHCARDPANAARWTHAGKKASHYGLRWNVAPGGKVATYNAGPLGLWSVTDGARFLSLSEILALLWKNAEPPPVVPPVEPPKPPTPPAPPSNKDAELTATGIRLASDLAPLVAKVIIIEDAHTNRTNPMKHLCTFMGNGQWGTGKPLSAYRAAVYQLFWNKEPRVPHHQGFPGAIKNVSHVMPSGAWNPPSTRNQ